MCSAAYNPQQPQPFASPQSLPGRNNRSAGSPADFPKKLPNLLYGNGPFR
jgi:hypothetical protein